MGLARVGLGVLLACLPHQPQARPTPLCQRPEVLQEVGRTVRLANYYSTIDEARVTEQPLQYANAVVCHAILLTTVQVETPRGWVPTTYESWKRYDVQVRGNRFFVQVAP